MESGKELVYDQPQPADVEVDKEPHAPHEFNLPQEENADQLPHTPVDLEQTAKLGDALHALAQLQQQSSLVQNQDIGQTIEQQEEVHWYSAIVQFFKKIFGRFMHVSQ